jgi:hypothetical protein
MPTSTIARPSKIYPHWDFLVWKRSTWQPRLEQISWQSFDHYFLRFSAEKTTICNDKQCHGIFSEFESMLSPFLGKNIY